MKTAHAPVNGAEFVHHSGPAGGLEAIECFERHQPDVTLMDLNMAEMDGVTAIDAICRAHPGARILVLTTYKGDVQALRALNAGACGYLLKSMMRKELVDALRKARLGAQAHRVRGRTSGYPHWMSHSHRERSKY